MNFNTTSTNLPKINPCQIAISALGALKYYKYCINKDVLEFNVVDDLF